MSLIRFLVSLVSSGLCHGLRNRYSLILSAMPDNVIIFVFYFRGQVTAATFLFRGNRNNDNDIEVPIMTSPLQEQLDESKMFNINYWSDITAWNKNITVTKVQDTCSKHKVTLFCMTKKYINVYKVLAIVLMLSWIMARTYLHARWLCFWIAFFGRNGLNDFHDFWHP